jgi:hypothetical protein
VVVVYSYRYSSVSTRIVAFASIAHSTLCSTVATHDSPRFLPPSHRPWLVALLVATARHSSGSRNRPTQHVDRQCFDVDAAVAAVRSIEYVRTRGVLGERPGSVPAKERVQSPECSNDP